MNYQTKVTVPNQIHDPNLVLDKCSECSISIMVDKQDKESGRKSRCTSCIIRAKLRGPLPAME